MIIERAGNPPLFPVEHYIIIYKGDFYVCVCICVYIHTNYFI